MTDQEVTISKSQRRDEIAAFQKQTQRIAALEEDNAGLTRELRHTESVADEWKRRAECLDRAALEVADYLTDTGQIEPAKKLHAAVRDGRAALAPAPAPEPKPIAWRHTMHMEGGQTREIFSGGPANPFGRPGKDYDETYRVTSEPLALAPVPAPEEVKPVAWLVHDSNGAVWFSEDESTVPASAICTPLYAALAPAPASWNGVPCRLPAPKLHNDPPYGKAELDSRDE